MKTSGTTEFDDDKARLDLDYIWAFLSEQAYWGRWRPRDLVEGQIRDAWRVVGAYRQHDGAMVGFARAFSDGYTLAYLADVFVDPAARGQGIGQALVEFMIEHGPGPHFSWMLHTRDAHGLYRRFRFAEPNGRFLERPGTLVRPARPPTANP